MGSAGVGMGGLQGQAKNSLAVWEAWKARRYPGRRSGGGLLSQFCGGDSGGCELGSRRSPLPTLPFVESSLTISARRRKRLAEHECLRGKQPRIAPMKIMLISAVSAIFISRTALACQVIVSPIVTFHGASTIAEPRAAQLESAARDGVVLCTTRYVTTTRSDGSSSTRKSVDCEE